MWSLGIWFGSQGVDGLEVVMCVVVSPVHCCSVNDGLNTGRRCCNACLRVCFLHCVCSSIVSVAEPISSLGMSQGAPIDP